MGRTTRRLLVAVVIGAVVAGALGVIVIVRLAACQKTTSNSRGQTDPEAWMRANDKPGDMSDSHISKGIAAIKEWAACSESDVADATSSKTSEPPFEETYGSHVTTTTVLSPTHASPGGVAVGLYNAWASGNRAEASNFANPRAIEQLFGWTPASSSPAHADPDCLYGDDMVNCRFGKVAMFLARPAQGDTWLVTYVEVYVPKSPLESLDQRPVGATWIAQLASVAFEDGNGALTEMLTSVRASIPDAVVLVSDDYASLRPGYWVVYQPGPFADGFAAVRYCDARGRTTRNSCMGRLLSHNAADIRAQCFRRDDGIYADACSS